MYIFHSCFAHHALHSFPTRRSSDLILTGSVAPPPASVNLTVEGSTDWIHWGLNTATDVDREINGGPLITNFSTIGSGTNVVSLTDSPSKASWIDGTPDLTVTNTPSG